MEQKECVFKLKSPINHLSLSQNKGKEHPPQGTSMASFRARGREKKGCRERESEREKEEKEEERRKMGR